MPTRLETDEVSSPQQVADACRVCGAPLGGAMVESGKWQVRRCTSCGSGVLWPLPTPDELDVAYHTNQYAKSRGQVWAPLGRVLDWLMGRRLDFAGLHDGSGKRLLDVGSGKGRLLRVARKRGFDVTGIEPHDDRSEFSIDQYGVRVFQGPLEAYPSEGSGFDVITMWHVLEHVPDPVSFLSAVRPLLADDGVLVLEVPSIANWAFKVTGRHWGGLQLPCHLEHFTPSSLTWTCRQAGFEVVKRSTFSIEHGPFFGWMQSLVDSITGQDSLLYRFLKRNWVPRSRSDYKDFAKLVGATLLVGLLSPALLVLSLVESRFDGGAVVRVVLKKG